MLLVAPPLKWLACERGRMRLLKSSNINLVMAETMTVSCKVPTRILCKKEVIGLGIACFLSNGDVCRDIMNKRAFSEVYW